MAKEVKLESTLLLKDINSTKANNLFNVNIPTFVILGKSNVGKSTLLNSLLKKNIARHGKTPGLTTFIQVFKIMDKGQDLYYMIDCPGFGYAQGGKNRERNLQDLVHSFLNHWKSKINCALFLLDIRRYSTDKKSKKQKGNLDSIRKTEVEDKTKDLYWIATLSECQLPTLIIATKMDKLSKNKQIEATRSIAQKLAINSEDIFPVSPPKNTGIKELSHFLKKNYL